MNSKNLGAMKTRNDLIKLQFAMPADNWTIQIVPEGNIGRPIRDVVTSRKLYSREQVAWFRERNANGYHIFGRPNSTRYILIDDLDLDAISQMKKDGLSPTVVVETSHNNFQVWITAANEELPIQVATELGKLLASKYGGDPGSADALHLGRMSGLRNKKPKYQTYEGDGGPLVKLITARTVPIVPDAIGALLDQARKLAERKITSSPSTHRGCVPTSTNITITDIDPSRSTMTETEAHEIYQAELIYQAQRLNWDLPISKGLRSHADFNIVKGLKLKYEYGPDDLAALLVYASDKASERGVEYVIGTVKASLNTNSNILSHTKSCCAR